MVCRLLCAVRGYSSANGRVNYKKMFVCSSPCSVQIPHADAVYSISDRKNRCPCCGVQLRTGSFTGVKPRRVYVIELDV